MSDHVFTPDPGSPEHCDTCGRLHMDRFVWLTAELRPTSRLHAVPRAVLPEGFRPYLAEMLVPLCRRRAMELFDFDRTGPVLQRCTYCLRRFGKAALMTWFKVDDSFYDHPKVFDAPDGAVALWARAGCWAARNLTDGFVPAKLPARLCDDPDTAIKELVERGLWSRAKGGYQFHDWTVYQPSAERVKATRAVRAEAGSRGGKAKAAKQTASKLLEAGQDFAKQNSAPSRPDPADFSNEKSSRADKPAQPRKRGTRIPDDFTVTDPMVAWARDRVPQVDGRLETEKFVNYWRAQPGQKGTKLDWDATWRNWMLNASGTSTSRRPAYSGPYRDPHPDEYGELK